MQSDVFSFGIVLLECILGTEIIQKQLQRVANNCFELNMGNLDLFIISFSQFLT